MEMLAEIIFNFLREPTKRNLSEDQSIRLELDRKIMESKPEFLKVVRDIQDVMVRNGKLSESYNELNIELGAGVIPMKSNFPNIKSTDIVSAAHLDGILDATNLDLKDNSIQTLFLQNTFHHLPDPQKFFEESIRVLKKGGRIVIVDPFHNYLSSFMYPILFESETFNKKGSWNDASNHAMLGANQALSFIVFKRDVDKFNADNPQLTLIHSEPLPSGLRYLLTGGLNFKKLMPDFFLRLVSVFEKAGIIPSFLSIHWVIVLEKSAES